MTVEIDKKSGFCFGVVRAINSAERELSGEEEIYCLGDIVHNSLEVERLSEKGLKVINRDEMEKLPGIRLMIRAHGEPPETYTAASGFQQRITDATCPIVLSLQQKVRKGFEEMELQGGATLIFGKEGHAEVIGLMGHTGNKAKVIGSTRDLEGMDFKKPARLFAQTTGNPETYRIIIAFIEQRYTEAGVDPKMMFKAHDTICRQVSNRGEEIRDFARRYDVVIFVSDMKSSNGKQLFSVCSEHNSRSHFVSGPDDIQNEWFKSDDKVGICGATSTPFWVMEQIKSAILAFENNLG
jgi:4-hydroxy-3-methylbut-2-en-1-yl diphosphate reductase